jgi:plasmid stabilization system protein ParE
LRNLHSYIAQDSQVYASSFVERIILSVEKLGSFPRVGRMAPEADNETIRELIYHNYRIIYRINDELIEIITVIHGRRDLGSFKPAPWDVD